jgi:hypothetical protein
MDSVLRQPRRVVRNLAAQSSERPCCLGRPAERIKDVAISDDLHLPLNDSATK